MLSFFGPHGRFDVRKSYAWSRLSKFRHQYRYAIATPGERPIPAVQWQYTTWPSRNALSIEATAFGRPTRRESASKSEGRSTQSDVGVEFKGVSWRSKASRSGIESEGWAEREDGKSP
jgi:hypothetical protein